MTMSREERRSTSTFRRVRVNTSRSLGERNGDSMAGVAEAFKNSDFHLENIIKKLRKNAREEKERRK
jgi:hypothetical protein